MEKDLLDSILNFNENGYMALPRKLAELIINQIPIRSAGTLYFYMLVYANFGDGKTNQGVKLIRGSIYLTPGDIMKLTGWSRSTAHEKIKLLEMSGLIERCTEISKNLFWLPHYEEHCGKSVRLQEQKTKRDIELGSETEKKFQEFFKYYSFMLEVQPAEQEKAHREWRKLSLEEREEAIRNVQLYKDTIRKKEHTKLACNYLKDKSFKF